MNNQLQPCPSFLFLHKVLTHQNFFRDSLLKKDSRCKLYLLVKARVRRLQKSWISALKVEVGVSLATAIFQLPCYQNLNQLWINFSKRASRSHSDFSCQHLHTMTSQSHCSNVHLRSLKNLHAVSRLTWLDFMEISNRDSLFAQMTVHSERLSLVCVGSTQLWLNVKNSRLLVGTLVIPSMIVITKFARTQSLTIWVESLTDQT